MIGVCLADQQERFFESFEAHFSNHFPAGCTYLLHQFDYLLQLPKLNNFSLTLVISQAWQNCKKLQKNFFSGPFLSSTTTGTIILHVFIEIIKWILSIIINWLIQYFQNSRIQIGCNWYQICAIWFNRSAQFNACYGT